MTNDTDLHSTIVDTKVCTKCKIEKSLDAFGNAGRGDDRRRSYCKACAAEYTARPDVKARQKELDASEDRRKARREKYDPETQKYEKIRLNYKLSREQYDKMLSDQNNACLICRKEGPLHIDHDHSCCSNYYRSCGKCVRGLLCTNCNNGIGRFADDPDLLRAAADYLVRTSM